MIAGEGIRMFEMMVETNERQDKLHENVTYFVSKMEAAGFDLVKGNTAIVPVMLYDAPLAVRFADELLQQGIYVIGFVYPVVPKGRARIRVQLSSMAGQSMGRRLHSAATIGDRSPA